MRRGASISSVEKKRYPVAADLDDDVEGGGGASTYNIQRSPSISRSSSGANGMDIGPMSGVGIGSGNGMENSHSQSKDRRQRVSRSYLTSQSSDSLQYAAAILFICTALLFPFLSIQWAILTLVCSSCIFGAIASLWLSQAVLQCDMGTAEMRAVSDPIREGAEGFLSVQYTAIAKFAIPLAMLIVVSYQFRPAAAEPKGVALLGNTMLGVVAALGFIFGATASALSGYTSMWVASQSNIRVASAARRTYGEALIICFRGGAFSAVLNLTLCITGVTMLYVILHALFVREGYLEATDIPMLCVGFGFGSSFVALFMQLGGGIYTKVSS
jgi:hypothetical protein